MTCASELKLHIHNNEDPLEKKSPLQVLGFSEQQPHGKNNNRVPVQGIPIP